MKNIIILIVLLGMSSCYNKDLKSIVHDIDSTPDCDTRNIFVHPKDTKKTLVAKIVILNTKADCYDDFQTITGEKIESYKNL